jgi:hypothetical protein
MKFLKIFTIALAALSVSACSDDEAPINTEGNVTVEMGQGTYSTKEGRGLVKLPLIVSGKRNGDVVVTFAIRSDYSNPALEEKNIYMTTKTVVIFPEDDTYNVEISIVDDKEMNEARWCDVTIASVEGATIGSQNFTQVEIKDNDSEPYDRCAGTWILKTATFDDAGKPSYADQYIELVSYDEDTNGYKNYYRVKGLVSGNDDLSWRAYYTFDDESKVATISFKLGESGGTTEINTTFGERSVVMMQLVVEGGQQYIVDKGNLNFVSDTNFTEMTVENEVDPGNVPDLAFLFNADGWYLYEEYFVMGMTRPTE